MASTLYGFCRFGGQDGSRLLSQCSTFRWMSLTAMARVPHPVRPKLPIWLQGTLILYTNRDLVIPACQSRTPWTGGSTSYAGLQKAYDCIGSFRFYKLQKKPVQSGPGECCPKKVKKKSLVFFWYSCHYVKIRHNSYMFWKSL